MDLVIDERTATAPGRLDGRVAIVTGSTGGVGLGIAQALADAGASVVLGGFGEPAPDWPTLTGLTGPGGGAAVHPGADLPQVRRYRRATVLDGFGCLDILVTHVGIRCANPIACFLPGRRDAACAIDLASVSRAIRRALPGMRRRGGGRIINVAPPRAPVGSPVRSACLAAEHDIIELTGVVAQETAGDGITCNAICPGSVYMPVGEAWIETRIETGVETHDIRDGRLARQPYKGFATIDEIGAAALFLASDAASTTGAVLAVDGGWTVH